MIKNNNFLNFNISKIILLIFAIYFLFIFQNCSESPLESDITELIKNGGFEVGYPNKPLFWDIYDSTEDIFISLNNEEKHSGKRSIKIQSNTDTSYCWLAQDIKPAPIGKHFHFSGWAKLEFGDVGFYVAYTSIYGDRTTKARIPIESSDQWKNYEFEVSPVPKNAIRMDVGLSLTGICTVWFDDISLTYLN